MNPNNNNTLNESELSDARQVLTKISEAYRKKVVGQDELRLDVSFPNCGRAYFA